MRVQFGPFTTCSKLVQVSSEVTYVYAKIQFGGEIRVHPMFQPPRLPWFVEEKWSQLTHILRMFGRRYRRNLFFGLYIFEFRTLSIGSKKPNFDLSTVSLIVQEMPTDWSGILLYIGATCQKWDLQSFQWRVNVTHKLQLWVNVYCVLYF